MFKFCYDSNFILSFSGNNQADGIKAFTSTQTYLDTCLVLLIHISRKW